MVESSSLRADMRSTLWVSLLVLCTPSEAAWWSPDDSTVAKELARAAGETKARRVAVLPLRDLSGRPCRSGGVLADRLIAHLVRRGVSVIERARLDSVVHEFRLGATGALDPRSVKELGRFLGADAIVTGTVVELKGDRVELQARLIDVETARVLSASSARVDRDWSEAGPSPGEPEVYALPARPKPREPTVRYMLPGIPWPD